MNRLEQYFEMDRSVRVEKLPVIEHKFKGAITIYTGGRGNGGNQGGHDISFFF